MSTVIAARRLTDNTMLEARESAGKLAFQILLAGADPLRPTRVAVSADDVQALLALLALPLPPA